MRKKDKVPQRSIEIVCDTVDIGVCVNVNSVSGGQSSICRCFRSLFLFLFQSIDVI